MFQQILINGKLVRADYIVFPVCFEDKQVIKKADASLVCLRIQLNVKHCLYSIHILIIN